MFLKKMNELRNTLIFRLTVLYALLFAVSSVVVFAVFYYRIQTLTMGNLKEELLDEIEAYAEELDQEGLETVAESVRSENEKENALEEFYRLVDQRGRILASTDMAGWKADPPLPADVFRDEEQPEAVFEILDLPDRDSGAILVTAAIGQGVYLQIAESLEEAEDYLEIFQRLFALLAVLLIGLSVGIGWFMARRATADTRDVTRTALEIANGDYNQRVSVEHRLEETRQLGEAFNLMLDRIQNLVKSMKEINDNIAHDLRSPLARIRGFAEMTVLKDASSQDYTNMAVNTMEECDALIDMINTMLDITEVEAGVQTPASENFDLADVLRGACELFRPIADEKSITIQTHIPERIPFTGDRRRLQRIITNVLENAIKYTENKGVVTVSAREEGGFRKIEINDTGIGISESELPRIFERFYRCDRSRSKQGVGLGLSLAKAYTRSMNGSIRVDSKISEGSTFVIEFA